MTSDMRVGLEAFLSAEMGESVTVTDLEPVSSVGNARDPWFFIARWGHNERSVEQRCVMLVKAAAGQLDTTLRPEFATIAALAGSGVPVPKALWLEETGRFIGRPFFITGWLPGTADTRVLRGTEHVSAIRSVAQELAAVAAQLHAVDTDRAAHLSSSEPKEVAAAQLAFWRDQFERHRLEPHPELVYVFSWLAQRRPVARRISIVHGDLRFGNILYDGDRLTALLDWEMVHLGDPVEDLGWVYRALWSPLRSLPFEEFLVAYQQAGGHLPEPEHLRWYQIFSEIKHSVISLTAGRSFADKATSSLRHADRAATIPAFMTRVWELLGETC